MGLKWGAIGNTIGNMIPPPPPAHKEKTGPIMNACEPSHWLHEISLSKTVGQHFSPGLYFFLLEWVGGNGVNFFPPYSQSVPNGFLKMFPVAHGFYPIWFAQNSIPLYKVKSRRIYLNLFCKWGPKRCFYWGHAQSSKNCWWANQYGSLKKEEVVSTPMNYN
jgi:hypothetical protein